MPIAPPGSPVSLNVLSPSLFSGLTVDRAGGNGSSSLLNFRTADPTIAWQSTLQQTIGARTQAASATIRGSAGYVGVSFSHAVDDVFGPLQGLAYQDQSGVAYPHPDAVKSTGDAVKLRIPFAGQVFGLSAVQIKSAGARACDRFSAPLPCGYGPHNSETTTLRTFQFRDTAVVGATAFSAVLFSAVQTQHDDFSNRMLHGVSYPLDAAVRIPTTGFQWTVGAPAGTKHSVSLAGYAVEGRSQSIAGPGRPPQLGDRIAYRTLTLSDSMRLTKALRATIAVGRQQNVAAASVYALSSVAFDPNAKDRLALRYSAGALSSATQTFDGVSDPVALQFDCNAPAGFGTGPQRGADKSTTTSTGFSWLHRLRGDDQLAFSAHRDVVYDGAVTTTIAAADVPAILPPGYADQADGIFRAVCGTTSPLPLDRQYLYAGAIGPVLTFGGASIAGRFAITPKAFIQPYYTFTSAVERGEAPFVSSRSSI
ncbi:MAG TPA: hypothetical protein VN224_05985, partial [Xanthomonadales bacterium]|nr:hypothetical protein [Xanthomonadales bacterium]